MPLAIMPTCPAKWFNAHMAGACAEADHVPPDFLTRRNPRNLGPLGTKKQGAKIRCCANVDSSYYLAKDKNGLNLGP